MISVITPIPTCEQRWRGAWPGNNKRKTGTIRHASGLHVRRIGASLRLLPVIPLPVLFAARAREGERHKPAARVSRDRNSSPNTKGKQGQTPCRFFNSPDGCRMGDACLFKHDKRGRSTSPARSGSKDRSKGPDPGGKDRTDSGQGRGGGGRKGKGRGKGEKGDKGDPNPVGRTPTCSVALISRLRDAHTGLTVSTLMSRSKRRTS